MPVTSSSSSTSVAFDESAGRIGSYQISVLSVTVRSVVCSKSDCISLAASESFWHFPSSCEVDKRLANQQLKKTWSIKNAHKP